MKNEAAMPEAKNWQCQLLIVGSLRLAHFYRGWWQHLWGGTVSTIVLKSFHHPRPIPISPAALALLFRSSDLWGGESYQLLVQMPICNQTK